MLKGYACAVLMILSETDGMEWRMDNIAIAKDEEKKNDNNQSMFTHLIFVT